MTLEERVARAILKVEFFDYEPEMYGSSLDVFFAEIDDEHLERAREQARAAIAIVMEEAAKAASPNHGDGIFNSYEQGRRDAAAAIRAMGDA